MSYPVTDARCEPTPIAFLNNGLKAFRKIFKIFVTYYGASDQYFRINVDSVNNISTRMYQRQNYYLFFHNKKLSQSRQAGLKAYWILRYRPVTTISSGSWKKEYDVNVYFAFFCILCDVLGECVGGVRKDIQTSVINKLLKEYEAVFIRAFSEYDISKEALMVVADNIKKMCLYEIRLNSQNGV